MIRFKFLHHLTANRHIVKPYGFRSKLMANHLHDMGVDSSEQGPSQMGSNDPPASSDPLVSASWTSGSYDMRFFMDDISKRMFRVEGLLISIQNDISDAHTKTSILGWQMSVLLGFAGAGGSLLLYFHINSTSSGGGNSANGGQPIFITLPTTGNETNILPSSPLVTANIAK